MKKFGLLSLIAALVFFASCNQGDEAAVGVDLDSDLTVEAFFEDVDAIADAGFGTVSQGRVEGESDEYISCATVTVDSVARSITIDFGEACEGPGGRVRSGKIIMTYSGRRFQPGSYRSITFENFSIDSTQIEGTRTLTNVTTNTDQYPTFNVTLTGGKVTFADGTFVSMESDITRVWYRMPNPVNDYTTITGTRSGVNRDGVEFASTITEELVFKRECRGQASIAVSGVRSVIIGGEEMIVDYGDGTCDNIVSVTRNGETTEIEIEFNPNKARRRLGGRG